MFYQEGFPIEIIVNELKNKNIESSIYHIADECLKHGWSEKTTIKKLIEIFPENKKEIINFCNSDYEQQREIIFNFLYSSKEEAKEWFNKKILNISK